MCSQIGFKYYYYYFYYYYYYVVRSHWKGKWKKVFCSLSAFQLAEIKESANNNRLFRDACVCWKWTCKCIIFSYAFVFLCCTFRKIIMIPSQAHFEATSVTLNEAMIWAEWTHHSAYIFCSFYFPTINPTVRLCFSALFGSLKFTIITIAHNPGSKRMRYNPFLPSRNIKIFFRL